MKDEIIERIVENLVNSLDIFSPRAYAVANDIYEDIKEIVDNEVHEMLKDMR